MVGRWSARTYGHVSMQLFFAAPFTSRLADSPRATTPTQLPPLPRQSRLLAAAISLAVLCACTQQSQQPGIEGPPASPVASEQSTNSGDAESHSDGDNSEKGSGAEANTTAANAKPENGEQEDKVKPFPIETFYTLLVAEVAGNREQYDLALANYYFQAEHTKDAGVAARATRIARFLNARRAALRSAQLWVELEPDNREAQLAATAELTLAGELDSAMHHAERALELGGDAPLQSVAATVVDNEELAKKVLPEFQRLSQKFPNN